MSDERLMRSADPIVDKVVAQAESAWQEIESGAVRQFVGDSTSGILRSSAELRQVNSGGNEVTRVIVKARYRREGSPVKNLTILKGRKQMTAIEQEQAMKDGAQGRGLELRLGG